MIIPDFNNLQRVIQYLFIILIVLYVAYRLFLPRFQKLTEYLLERIGWSAEKRYTFVSENRCSPIIIPFIGVLNNNISTVDNFQQCISSLFASFFAVYIKSFSENQSRLAKIVTGMSNDLVSVKRIVKHTREALLNILQDVYNRLYSAFRTLRRLFNQMKLILVGLLEIFRELFSVLIFVYYSLQSMWNGPIGKTARFFCFHGDTMILLKNKKYVQIQDIKLGDELFNNAIVSGILKLPVTKNTKLYNYNGTIVSGNHLTKHNSKWTRINKIPTASVLPENEYPQNLYSLNVTGNEIIIGNDVYADYDECSSPKIREMIIKCALFELNKQKHNGKICIDPPGFYHESELAYVQKIDGNILTISSPQIQLYEYKKIIASGSMIVLHKGKWTQLINCGKKLDKKIIAKQLYNCVTQDGIIQIEKEQFRDYSMSYSVEYNNLIDTIVENFLNNSK